MTSNEFSNEITILKYRFKRNKTLKSYSPGITVNTAFLEELIEKYEDLYYKDLVNVDIIEILRRENSYLKEQLYDQQEEKQV